MNSIVPSKIIIDSDIKNPIGVFDFCNGLKFASESNLIETDEYDALTNKDHYLVHGEEIYAPINKGEFPHIERIKIN